jgi:hypothetical protein
VKAHERRTDKRIVDAGLGRKKISDLLIEEAAEDALDWAIERGGWRKLWAIIKVVAFIFVALVAVAIIYLIEHAN